MTLGDGRLGESPGRSTEYMKKVIYAMLAMQRYPWEQGVCAQALFEAEEDGLWIPMAYEAGNQN